MRTHDEINEALISLWKEQYPKQHYDDVFAPMRYYHLPEEEPEPWKAIVFVGLNPSFSENRMREMFKKEIHQEIEPREFFRWPLNKKIYNEEIDHRFEENAFNNYPYFTFIKLFKQHCHDNVRYFDILPIRGTSRDTAINESTIKKPKLNPFGQSQFNLFWNRIEITKPLSIVIINADACHIYENQRLKSINYDKDNGYYFDSIDGREVPVFFAGMLSGKRPMDIGSRHRLFWQVAKQAGKSYDPKLFKTKGKA